MSQKTWLRVFNNNLNNGLSIAVIFYYLDNKLLNIFLIAHLTYFVWLSYFKKLSKPDNHELRNCNISKDTLRAKL